MRVLFLILFAILPISLSAQTSLLTTQDATIPTLTVPDTSAQLGLNIETSNEEALPDVESTVTEQRGSAINDSTSAVDLTDEIGSTEARSITGTSVVVENDAGLMGQLEDSRDRAVKFLKDGGPSIWAIAALSVITLTLILWKIWRLVLIGAWSKGRAGKAVSVYQSGRSAEAMKIVRNRRSIRSKVFSSALDAVANLPEERAREETARIAKRELASAAGGLRALELIATIAPLLGLLGTVLGMIAAFQALQDAGSRADPAVLAGGIWEALLTTAAGMAVAIPAAASLTWFESVIERIRRDVEDAATVIFVRRQFQEPIHLAAE